MSFFAENITKFFRNSHGRCFIKKGFLEILQNSQESTCATALFLIKLQALALQLYLKETVAQVFSYEFCEISKNTFFTEYLWETASDSVSFSKQLFSELLWMVIASYMLKYIKVLVLVKSVPKIKHFLGLSGLFTNRFLFIVFTNCTNLSAAP